MAPVDPRKTRAGLPFLLLGALALILGAGLPWFDAAGETVTGLEHTDGYVTVGVAFGVLALAIGLEWAPLARVGSVLGAVLSLWIAITTYRRVADLPTHDPAIGLWLTGLGGIALLAAATWGTVAARRQTEPMVLLGDDALADDAEDEHQD